MFELIKKLFPKAKKGPVRVTADSDVQTAPLSDEQLISVSKKKIDYYPPQLVVGCAQSVGKHRDHNEDALFVFSTTIAEGDGSVPLGLFLIADGMGGHMHGEIASGSAARAAADFVMKKIFSSVMGVDPEPQGESLQEVLEMAVQEAQQVVLKRAPGGGTTLTIALVMGDQVTMAHVGDSRAYFGYPDGRIQIMTQDHSLVHRLVELGQLTEEQAKVYPQKNVLYRALGQAEPFRPDIHTHLMPNPGYLLICSDGLWGTVPDQRIFEIVKDGPDLTTAAHRLVDAANQAGGPDNISVILVQYFG